MSTAAPAPATAPAAPAPAEAPQPQAQPQPAAAPTEAPAERVLRPIPPRAPDGKFAQRAMPGEPGFTAPGAAKLPWDDSDEPGPNDPIMTLDGQVSEEKRPRKPKQAAAPISAPGAEELAPADQPAEPLTPEQVEAIARAEEPAAGKFMLGDVEFPSQEAAVQAFKTMRGQLAPTMRQNEQLKQSAAANAAAAQAWKAEAERLAEGQRSAATSAAAPSGAVAGVAQPQAATAASAGQSAVAQGAEALGLSEKLVREAIDWPHFKATFDEHGPDVAMFMALEGLASKLLQHSDSRFDELSAPTREASHARSVGESINGIIFGTPDRLGLVEATRADGQPLYPALSDDSAVAEIAQIIVRMHKDDGWTEQQINSPKGVHHAYLLWKDWRERTGNPWRPSPAAATPGAPSTPPEPQRHSPLAPGPSMPARPATTAQAVRGERIRRSLKEVDAPNSLGYSE